MSDTGNTSDAPAAAPEDLDQRVQALIDEIEHTTARIEQAVADDADDAEGPSETQDEAEGAAEADSEPDTGPATQPAPEEAPEAPKAAQPPEPASPEPAPPEPAAAAEAEPAPDPEAPDEPAAASQPVTPEAAWEPAGEPPEAQPPEEPTPAAAPSSAQEPASGGPPQSLDSLDADLEADLDRLLAAEACAEPGPQVSTPEESAASDPELEQELDELLREGEITAPDTEAAASESGSSKLDEQLAGLRDDDLKGGPEPRRFEPEEEEAGPASPGGPAQPPAPGLEKAEKPAPRRSLVKAAMIELADFVRRGGPQVARRVEPVAYQAAVAMNKPLEERTRAKQIVGWLALYTAFLAACVWVYVLFLRPAGPPERGEQGAALVGVGE